MEIALTDAPELSEVADRESDASIRRMTSFAVMTVDWSNHGRSYLDNFVSYALAVIPPDSPSAIARESIRPLIEERFNLTLPAGIVQQLIRRAIKLGFLAAVGELAVRMTDKGKREVAPIPYTLRKLAKEQSDLARHFADWASSELQIQFHPEQATAVLLDYVETYYCSLMSLADGDGSIRQRLPKIEPSAEQKIAAAFVTMISETDDDLFESIANMARGSMMVSVLYAPALVDSTRGFRNTTIYLDTKIVLRALGYEGDLAKQATQDLLHILGRQGARLAIFEFTLTEIRSVIDAVAFKSRNGSMWTARPGSVESFFYKIDASQSLIEQHSVRVESSILGLGMHIDPKPDYGNHRYVVDETEIEAALKSGNPNYRQSALRHDVELISSVVRARAGRSRQSLEESRATFMTLNSLVVFTARTAQRQYNEAWPLAMFEMDIAALTWVKEPLAAPNLPKQLLLATSLGLMNPETHDWSLYIGEISRLLESTAITDNDVILLRQKYEMDRLAFVNVPTRAGDGERKSSIKVSIESARAAVAAELTAPIRAEVQESTTRIGELESTLRSATAAAETQKMESDALARTLLKPVWKRGEWAKWIVVLALLFLAALAILATFAPGAATVLEAYPGGIFVLWGIRTVAAIAAVVGGVSGPIQRFGLYARRKYILSGLERTSIAPDRAAGLGFKIE
jgi:hypothetical protein